ncbi:MAG: acyltransferase [Nitrospirales bacterium]|nr:MAG: acyltransferase [Nitrospirales bacterium]
MQPTQQPHSQYRPQLDSLRAIAVLAVLVHHYYPGSEFLGLGYYGVRLFFVLSGFLITGILLDSRYRSEQAGQGKKVAFYQFYARRMLRILPVYYCALFLTWLAGNPDVLSGAWWYATYTSNLLFMTLGFFPLTTAHLWSLSVEAHFYLFWPCVIFFVSKQYIHWSILLTILAGPAYRLFSIVESHDHVEFYTSTLSSIDSLGWGALLAWLIHTNRGMPVLQNTGRRIFLFLPIMTPLLMNERYFYVVDTTLLSIAFVWLVEGAAKGFRRPVGALMNWKPLLYIGQISYGIYLYHLFIPWVLYEFGGFSQPAHVLINTLLLMTSTILLASLSWHFFERPVMSLKKYFSPSGAIPAHKEPHSTPRDQEFRFSAKH